MKANEIRIGNLVYITKEWGEKIDTKVMVWDEAIWYAIGDCLAYLEDFEPIPITEEWLLRFGFETYKDIFNNRYDCINGFEMENINTYCGVGNNQQIKYVHQLQNLY